MALTSTERLVQLDQLGFDNGRLWRYAPGPRAAIYERVVDAQLIEDKGKTSESSAMRAFSAVPIPDRYYARAQQDRPLRSRSRLKPGCHFARMRRVHAPIMFTVAGAPTDAARYCDVMIRE